MMGSDVTMPPSFMFGAGEMADHIVHLMQWSGVCTSQLRLFDDRWPGMTSGPCGLPVVGSVPDGVAHCRRVREPAIIALGSRCTAFRWGLYQRLSESGVPLASVIHPSTIRAPDVEIGENAIVFPGVTMAKGVRIAAMCTFWSSALVEHDSVVGDNVTIGPAAKTSGYVRIGEHAFLGVGATIAPKIHIGARALIGAGAVVVRDVEAGMVMAGVPAKVLRPVGAGMDAPTIKDLVRFAPGAEGAEVAGGRAGCL